MALYPVLRRSAPLCRAGSAKHSRAVCCLLRVVSRCVAPPRVVLCCVVLVCCVPHCVLLYAVIYRYMLDKVLGEYDDPKEMFCCGEIIVINWDWEDTKVSMCVYVLLYIYLYCSVFDNLCFHLVNTD